MTGAEFREARQRAGLSHRKAAAALGVAPSTIFKWETGAHSIPSDAADAIRARATAIDRAASLGDPIPAQVYVSADPMWQALVAELVHRLVDGWAALDPASTYSVSAERNDPAAGVWRVWARPARPFAWSGLHQGPLAGLDVQLVYDELGIRLRWEVADDPDRQAILTEGEGNPPLWRWQESPPPAS